MEGSNKDSLTYIAGNIGDGSAVYYRLFVPSDGWLLNNIILALTTLEVPENWLMLGDVTREQIQAIVTECTITFEPGAVMTGGIVEYMGRIDALPYGYLLCDGTEYNASDWPRLWAVCHDNWKTGVDTFRVPDMRGRAPIGVGQGVGLTLRSMADSVGSENHTLTVGELPAHHHAYDPVIVGDLDVESFGVPQPNAAQIIPAVTENTYDTGNNEPHNNMQPSTALYFVVIAI